MKRKYGGGQSKESAKISVDVEGPNGAPAETTHPDGCERAPLVETTPNPALQPLWRGHGKVRHPSRLWRRWQTWGGGVSHWAPQLLSIWSYQWHVVIGQLIVTSPKRDQIAHACGGTLVRLDKKDGRNLSVWRKRGTRDLSRHELTLNQALRTSAPLFFPHRSLRGRKREGARGGIALWKESDAHAQRGETDALAVRAIRTSERGIRMGFPQAGNTLAVTVIGVQVSPARAAVTARH